MLYDAHIAQYFTFVSIQIITTGKIVKGCQILLTVLLSCSYMCVSEGNT